MNFFFIFEKLESTVNVLKGTDGQPGGKFWCCTPCLSMCVCVCVSEALLGSAGGVRMCVYLDMRLNLNNFK